ncbi:MAG: hypothetical protein ACOX4M_10305 [Acetivibrionales bacterium]
MKKALIVAYSYPPLANKESARIAGFVEQLGNYGWEPLVLTRVSTPEGGCLHKNLPEPAGINVVRSGTLTSESLPRFFRAFARFFASLLIPDKERLWELFCARKAVRIAKYEGIDLVYTISPPFSAHLIGLRLKKKTSRHAMGGGCMFIPGSHGRRKNEGTVYKSPDGKNYS